MQCFGCGSAKLQGFCLQVGFHCMGTLGEAFGGVDVLRIYAAFV